ncbi:MAG TPA: hypothetical protein VL988_09615 [Solirubrobacteraceae bacterium]|nr:hypothetical protein [Solirubrobacteraceae bacterium]
MKSGPTTRQKVATVALWSVIVGLSIGDAGGWHWARAVCAVLGVIWVLFVALPWLHWYFRGGKHTTGWGRDEPTRTPRP